MLSIQPPGIRPTLPRSRVESSEFISIEKKYLITSMHFRLKQQFDNKKIVHISNRFVERVEWQGCQVRIAPVNTEDRRNNPTTSEIAPHIRHRVIPHALEG